MEEDVMTGEAHIIVNREKDLPLSVISSSGTTAAAPQPSICPFISVRLTPTPPQSDPEYLTLAIGHRNSQKWRRCEDKH